MSKPICCLKNSDLDGNKIVFHEKRRRVKARTHFELNDLKPNGFVKQKIPQALVDPYKIFQDITDKKIKNYYKIEHYIDTRWSRIYTYTKVVVATIWKPWVILTAYYTTNIKEEWQNKNLCLYQKP